MSRLFNRRFFVSIFKNQNPTKPNNYTSKSFTTNKNSGPRLKPVLGCCELKNIDCIIIRQGVTQYKIKMFGKM